MTLIQQIQTEALETHGDLAALLRRCRILAQRLGLDELKQWVTHELEGYPSDSSLPEYRKVPTHLILGHFNGFAGAQIKNAQIPVTEIPEQLREPLTNVYFREGIAEISQMLHDNPEGLRAPWPVEAVRLVGQGNIYDGYFLMQALRVVNKSALRGILDQVQNRILVFALELESRNPEAGEAIMKSDKIADNDVRNIFYRTVVRGDVQNLAQGGDTISQTACKTIMGDFETLRHSLAILGVEGSDIGKLQKAINQDKSSGDAGIGRKTKAWLGDVALKTGKGAISAGAAAAVTEAVKQFFGG